MENTKIIDIKIIYNINHLLGDNLKEQLTNGQNARLKIALSYFPIYAFSMLKSELQNIEEL